MNIFKNFKKYSFGNVTNSQIKIYENCEITERPLFEINENWFLDLFNNHYDDEIKFKYIPELHQDTQFEEDYLIDILNFEILKKDFTDSINRCIHFLEQYEKNYSNLQSYFISENIIYKSNIEEKSYNFKKYPEELYSNINAIKDDLKVLIKLFELEDYDLLNNLDKLNLIYYGELKQINYTHDDWKKILEKEPEYQKINSSYKLYNLLLNELKKFNISLENFKKNYNHKIIVGTAGTGKSHYLAHLVQKIIDNQDFAIFIKPKLFSGDNINFEEKLLEILQIPKGYIVTEILEKLNEFANQHNKRCFILIDALNETTKSNIGFSNIWKTNLQIFINQIKQYNKLYIVCTLRTSYIEKIWETKPKFLAEIKGFENRRLTISACKNYFKYYKINVTNFDNADLNIFRKPLLLDLFCKLTNSDRNEIKQITINIETYVEIFENYILDLIREVKEKLNLESSVSITNGFKQNSAHFYEELEAVISKDIYTSTFDSDPLISQDNSIARAVLEGYLVFIREVINKSEIVKHTQQEVGGYLIAKMISEEFSNIQLLLESQNFINRIVGNNTVLHHQLRLDILKFLIALRPEMIPLLEDNDSIKLSWDYLFNSSQYRTLEEIPHNLKNSINDNKTLEDILNRSERLWFEVNSTMNFNLVSYLLQKKDSWNRDLVWNYYIYNEGSYIFEYLKEFRRINKNYQDDNFEYLKLGALFASEILSTNIRELRDLSTIFLIEFGEKFPMELLDLTINFSTFNDVYVYERLVSCCYGVMLIKQNNKSYIEENLPKIASELYNIQFSEKPKAPSYNYIVIDSIKHLLDFAILKDVIILNEDQKNRISNYEFFPSHPWVTPNKAQQKLINKSHEMSWPEPIGMDFGIYTIPRLIKQEENKRNAIVNVYKRIFELGYQNLDLRDSNDDIFKDFYYGHSYYRSKGKIDRLGKKYSWISFFDYAGYLLLNKKLNVYDTDDVGINCYQRLSDVDIDISLPNKSYDIEVRIYDQNLLERKTTDQEWYNEIKIDSVRDLFKTKIDDGIEYSMLYGYIQQRLDDEYKVRSYLMIETMFVEKNDDFKRLKKESDIFEWKFDIHVSREHLYNVYFGELYWADTNCTLEKNSIGIPNGKCIKKKRILGIYDIIRNDNFTEENVGDEIEENYMEHIWLNSESTLLDYLWESDSEILKGFGEFYPSVRMGKHLNLKADPKSGKILDENLNDAYKCIHYEDESFFKNTFNYMRTDLLKRYMEENNLALVYQIKQHSHDKNYLHNRKLKFFIIE